MNLEKKNKPNENLKIIQNENNKTYDNYYL